VAGPVTTPAQAGSGRYAPVAIALHWAIALAILLQVSLAGRMEGRPTPESFAVTQLHKSIGITILLLSLVRLAWRLMHPPGPLPLTMAGWERALARLTHVGFYGIMIAMPLTGWLMVSTSRIVVPTLLYGAVPWPDLPVVGGLAPAARHLWHEVGETGHGVIAKVIYVLLALHVAGALKHQFFSRDEPVLARMAPGAVPGRWLEPRLAVIALAVVGAFAFGRLVQPPQPAMAAPPIAAAPAAEPVEAQGPAASSPAPPVADTGAPVRWQVQGGSTLAFTTAWSGSPVQGRFDRWKADILFNEAALDRSKVTVTIDMSSASTGDPQRDASLPAPDWFDSAAHPVATFTAGRFTRTGEGRYVAHGQLSLRGVTKPLDLPFELKIEGDRAAVSARASLDRLAFGVGQGEFSATDQIPAKVQVRVQLQAKRGPTAGSPQLPETKK
jgi:cytochrome b561/polyisoprenoid-binding protein YceI